MKVHFLGTAAAEGFPNPFCLCEACQKARYLGGRNIRSRTSVLFDDVLKVDFPPDFYYHAIYHNIDLTLVKDLLFTHTHYDHFNPGDLFNRIEGFAHGIEHPLHIYGNDLVMQGLHKTLPASQENRRFAYHRVLPFKEVETQTVKITPLLADHDPMETCLLYYIERNGKRILYGNDTGWFPEDTWNWLKGRKIDLAILDCTGGFHANKRSRNHMCIETILEVQQAFQQEDILEDNGQIIVTHFSHNSGLLHEDFVKAFQPYGIQVAYDGMIVTL
ncbi:MBL fold metallo-hydrolase [Lederbergia sp. NSJ-179]|uniref:MBL fold metallo-hydrolase n=1 Tax=Lederbergia sp. NSJ-179 TaxID=2931402 RepID=UPI001FD001CA|nr:MBL fold metallo-hydrolase [Lederbergia sp. NSJ-179]MCJ7841332.1 MBL fold metallo-hydrolase [Lederbergia sp. NSJ-179]